MGDVIDLKSRLLRKDDSLISANPIEFRRGDWQGAHAVLCRREESKRYEEHRAQALSQPDHQHLRFVPNHFSLTEGYHYTVMGLFRHRRDEAMMRRVYRLAGLMECVTNVPSPVLRSDLLRRFYQFILEERTAVEVTWGGDAQHFLLPLDPGFYNPNLFAHYVSMAASLMDLYDVIEVETGRQFDILREFYVIYLPQRFTSPNE